MSILRIKSPIGSPYYVGQYLMTAADGRVLRIERELARVDERPFTYQMVEVSDK